MKYAYVFLIGVLLGFMTYVARYPLTFTNACYEVACKAR